MKRIVSFLAALVALPAVLAAQPADNDDPFTAMLQLQREMDAVMARFHDRMMREQGFGDFMPLHATMPKTDLRQKGDTYELTMEIPGADAKSIDIHAENGIVTVTAKREEVRDENESNYYRHERLVSSYARSVLVPADADTEHMKTEYKNGVLTIVMPKKKL
jgi:HSP20 family protein